MQPNNPIQPNGTNNDGPKPFGDIHRPTTDGFNTTQNLAGPTQQLPTPTNNPQLGQKNGTNLPQPINNFENNQTSLNNQQPTPEKIDESYASDIDEGPFSGGKHASIKNTLFTIALFVMAPLFAIFMILFVFQSYVVDGSSMEPTLQNGDRVFILKLPKSLANIKNEQWVPARNEIIVFKKPYNEGTQLIKRVIGLPGDKVVIKDGEITVYNIDNPQGFHPDEGTDYKGTLAVYESEQNMEANVGQGEIFVLGDNRTPGGSLDSHSGLGLVPIDHIVGRLWIRYFPLSGFNTYASNLNFSLAL